MYIPYIGKITTTDDIFVERTLPAKGQVLATEGTKVVPYDHVGICTYSHKTMKLPKNFSPVKFKKNGQYYYYGNDMGKVGMRKIVAPFSGNLTKLSTNQYVFEEEPTKYILLSGVWGTVEKVSGNDSLLIKTRTKDINLVISTEKSFAGELVVFPNPAHVLEKFYLDEFSSGSPDGKIVYVGNNVSLSILQDAMQYGIGAVLAGSADKEVFKFAQEKGMCFGLLSGFGDMTTPEDVYSFLNGVSSRFVFFHGERNILRVPLPPDEMVNPETKKTVQPLRLLKKGLKVLVLQKPYFGRTGVVDRIEEFSIFVRFNSTENPVEVRVPNLFALE